MHQPEGDTDDLVALRLIPPRSLQNAQPSLNQTQTPQYEPRQLTKPGRQSSESAIGPPQSGQ